jgi:hypothetical protein
MGAISYAECLDAILADGTQISNTITETIMCPDFNIPAFYMQPGRVIRITTYYEMSNVITTPGNIIFRLRWGGVGGTVLCVSGAIALNATARTNFSGYNVWHIVCRTAGSAGSMSTHGLCLPNNTVANVSAQLLYIAPQSGTSVVSSVDTTTDKLLSCTAQFSVNTSPTNLTCQDRIIELVN